ncbi:hypothetical protein DAPPUDRAFT_238346 [Daphnia pulex]|uniref:Uncharacterized protein n=1 Tax=Daphnia pulex TaxID=6669 RepID=E9G662_DAPPU|nr:hypothetical protein DAPPUDRAFT_238346 [Daphnia pulex]|eukprot:EFX85048.1 hypothetical protein DAPPUDRAFT_238346 [Daphnia pulex]
MKKVEKVESFADMRRQMGQQNVAFDYRERPTAAIQFTSIHCSPRIKLRKFLTNVAKEKVHYIGAGSPAVPNRPTKNS